MVSEMGAGPVGGGEVGGGEVGGGGVGVPVASAVEGCVPCATVIDAPPLPRAAPLDVSAAGAVGVGGAALPPEAVAAARPNFIAPCPASAAPMSGAAPEKLSLKLAMRVPWSCPGVPEASA